MKDVEVPSNRMTNVILAMAGAAAAAMIVAATLTIAPGEAQATPERAKKAGNKPCGYCHVNPGGGGKLNSRGEGYKGK